MTDDYLPPKRLYMDDIPVFDPEIGAVPLWKSILWNAANLRREIEARADTAAAPYEEEQKKPPPLVADAAPKVRKGDGDTPANKTILDSISKIEKRLDEWDAERERADREAEVREAVARAERALHDAEEAKDPLADCDDAKPRRTFLN